MRLADDVRAAVLSELAPQLLQLVADEVERAEGDAGDFRSIGVTALTGAAVAIAAGSCIDARAAVALVRCTAESEAALFYRRAA